MQEMFCENSGQKTDLTKEKLSQDEQTAVILRQEKPSMIIYFAPVVFFLIILFAFGKINDDSSSSTCTSCHSGKSLIELG